ncbi:MAG TPA: malonate transporter subunit MadM [Syntrophales bacterium]|nr:malonate transporter subunit MadM [Syntrophales bacterium]HOL59760.1 malonate transporter subunit MadM [Syntrophales bacterium]HPO35930.1 malonate transporter subunit MadM [Syntrophales bacterium]
MWPFNILQELITKNGLIWALLVVGLIYYVSMYVNKYIFREKSNTFTIAMIIAMIISGIAGLYTGKAKGLADVKIFAGVGLLGGSMLRDYAIVATAYGAKIEEIRRGGVMAMVSLIIGVVGAYIIGVIVALIFGFTDVKDITTIGAGACTFIVGPVTGESIGASSQAIALSVAAGVVKAVLAMILIPLMGNALKINNPQAAMVMGGLIGTTSGTVAGLTALNPALVPYGAMTATFYTGLGCLLCPSVLFLITRAIL